MASEFSVAKPIAKSTSRNEGLVHQPTRVDFDFLCDYLEARALRIVVIADAVYSLRVPRIRSSRIAHFSPRLLSSSMVSAIRNL